jgi:predicted RNase H-like HicB family nuclease
MAGTELARSCRSVFAGSSFEDAKRKMEAALQEHIESVLHWHSGTKGKRAA